jgi:hypothetical protein
MSEELFSSGYGEPSGSGSVEEPTGSTGYGDEASAGTWGEEATGETGAEEPVYEIDGKQYTASELREMIKGGMLERDYRIKTAQLAEERRQLEQLRQAAEAWQALQQYPELVETLRQKVIEILQGGNLQQGGLQAQAMQGAVQGQQGETDPLAQELANLRYQLAALQADYASRVQQYNQYLWQQYYAQREAYARSQLPELQKRYPMLYDEEVIEAFKIDPEADLEALAKASHEHWNKFYSERAKADIAKRQENAKARVAAPTARGGTPATPRNTPQSFEEARRLAIERLAQAGLFSKG